MAAKRGYSPRKGIVLGILLGPIALVGAALLLPRTAAGREQLELENKLKVETSQYSQRQDCPKCGRDVSVMAYICPRCGHHFQ